MPGALLFFMLAWLFAERDDEHGGFDISRRAEPPPPPPRPPRPRPRLPPPVAPQPSAPPIAAKSPGIVPAAFGPAPWPQVVPAGLPGFPGPGWVPAEPPGAAVVARANQLLPVLWRHGPGTFKVEQTGGRWIAYRATQMGTKRGVVAFKERAPAAPVATVVTPPMVIPASAPAPAAQPASPVALPTLRRGSRGAAVKTLQRRLGIADDGIFGGGTEASVKAYQRSHGLLVDGVVGRQTWTSLFGGN